MVSAFLHITKNGENKEKQAGKSADKKLSVNVSFGHIKVGH